MAPPTAIDVEGVSDTEGIVLPDLLTIHSIAAGRAKSGKLVAGTAAWTSSDLFKTPSVGKPKSKRWDHLLSIESKSRMPGKLKGIAKYLKHPGIISLGGGLPCSENFPIESISVKVPQAPHFTEQETRDSGLSLTMGKYDVSEGTSVYDLSIALNYGLGSGSAQLVRFVTEHTELVSNPPYADWQCVLTVGNTFALDQAYRMFTKRGDYVIFEEYTYSSAKEASLPLGLKAVSIKMDSEGLLPGVMDDILSSWDEKSRGARKPRFLYTIPSGHNPTGATQGVQRRRDLYKVCQKHDIYILEDEPYYFLQMQPYTGQLAPDVPAPSSHEEFLKALVPTLLSMDVDGRVMRMDSFSKVIAPGMRTSWITASEQVIERFTRASETSTQNPSGISQAVLYKMLDEGWGHKGYLEWLIHLRLEYTRRRDAILGACEKFLPRDIVSWNPPAAGMFLWLEIDWKKHPEARTKDLLDIEEDIFTASVEKGVLVCKGSWFASGEDHKPTQMFFRTTFAAASNEKMAEAIERFGMAVRESFRIGD